MVAWLNRTYTVPTRFYKDDDTVNDKIWYWAEEGATQFPFYHLQASRHFMDGQVLTDDWGFPGEMPGNFRFNNGANPHGAQGNKGCYIGDPLWWAEGVPAGQVLNPDDIPVCCGTWDNPILPVLLFSSRGGQVFDPAIDLTFPKILKQPTYVVIGCYDDGSGSPLTVPAGWLAIQQSYQFASNKGYCLILYRELDGSEPDILHIPNDWQFCGWVLLVAQHASNVESSSHAEAANAPWPLGSVSAAGDNRTILAYHCGAPFVSAAWPAPYTEIQPEAFPPVNLTLAWRTPFGPGSTGTVAIPFEFTDGPAWFGQMVLTNLP